MTLSTTEPLGNPGHVMTGNAITLALRVFALTATAFALLFVLNNFLIFWRGWPGILNFFAHLGVMGFEPLSKPLDGTKINLGWVQLAIYAASIAGIIIYVLRTRMQPMMTDSLRLTALAAFLIRGAFWAVLLVGVVDATISLLRVEGLLEQILDPEVARNLGRSSYRGLYVHYPLIAVGFVVGLFTRTLGFTWLALLIVAAEMIIVISRFVFSYEQAYMGDLVRFWYASLFLFASAYTLIEEGHVRVDILYTGFTERGKSWSNAIGTVILGLPVCWIVLTLGMWGKSSLINAPMLNYEVSQSGYGMYVKYLMVGFLMVYALSMLVQFMAFFLRNTAVLANEIPSQTEHNDHEQSV